jgi:uncharacterized membrane protein
MMDDFWKSFTDQQKAMIKRAIEVAEMDTSGEIRVHIENTCKDEPMNRAAFIFSKLAMHKTIQRNGVLFYVAVRDRKFVILGDAGINQKVPEDFWKEITEEVLCNFREGRFTEGLVEGIRRAGQQLKAHFPYQRNDENELTNEISFGEDIES